VHSERGSRQLYSHSPQFWWSQSHSQQLLPGGKTCKHDKKRTQVGHYGLSKARWFRCELFFRISLHGVKHNDATTGISKPSPKIATIWNNKFSADDMPICTIRFEPGAASIFSNISQAHQAEPTITDKLHIFVEISAILTAISIEVNGLLQEPHWDMAQRYALSFQLLHLVEGYRKNIRFKMRTKFRVISTHSPPSQPHAKVFSTVSKKAHEGWTDKCMRLKVRFTKVEPTRKRPIFTAEVYWGVYFQHMPLRNMLDYL